MNTKPAPAPMFKKNIFGLSEGFKQAREVDVEKVRANPNQPRKHFDQEELEGLAESIKDKGLLQPILVKVVGEGEYEIVAGERRWRAHKLAQLSTISVILTEGDTEEIALIENVQRSNLQPIEEAEAIGRLMTSHSYTLENVGKAIGKSKQSMSELMSLLKLPEDIRGEIQTGTQQFTKATLIELARLEDAQQRQVWETMRAGLTVTVREVREIKKSGGAGQGVSMAAPTIKDAVKGLYAFAKRAQAHEGEVSKDDLKVLKEAKRQADDAYRSIITRAS